MFYCKRLSTSITDFEKKTHSSNNTSIIIIVLLLIIIFTITIIVIKYGLLVTMVNPSHSCYLKAFMLKLI